MRFAYCVNENNRCANSLIAKLVRNGKPGRIILLTAEEMKLLTDKKQFTTIEVNDKEE